MSKLIIRSQDNECPHAGTILAYHDTDPSWHKPQHKFIYTCIGQPYIASEYRI